MSSSPLEGVDETFFQKLTSHYEKQLPFVAYRKPNENLVNAFLQKSNTTFYAENFTEKGFVFAPFDSNSKALLIPEQESEILKVDFELTLPKKENSVKKHEIPAFAGMWEHIQLVQKGIDEIKRGTLQKVVLSHQQNFPIPEENPLIIFEKLLQEYPTAFVYCWFHPQIGCWLGATPETLVQIEHNQLKTMALAGTQKYTGNMVVSWGEKEKKEQQLVTDAIVSGLQGKVENLKISDPKTMKAGSLLHLKTDIFGDLKNSDLKEILRDLHPTPAVCGLPKEKAKQFILENEGYDREFYTGFLGELNMTTKKDRSSNRRNQENKAYSIVKKQTNLFVNLRCMKFEKGKAQLFLGGGIVKDSDPESEWEETVNKAQTMLKVL
ncbi:MAG TPA: chorismate-binding protein [Flavobacteriaceae bacterium]|nr:chorismate-binding protein [Flavobacteriaceae bacterium]